MGTSPSSSGPGRSTRGPLRRVLSALREVLARYFVAGLISFAPIGITLWAIAAIVQTVTPIGAKKISPAMK